MSSTLNRIIEEVRALTPDERRQLREVIDKEAPTAEELGWPPGFFEETAGMWQGEPLTRGEQGEYEIRKKMQ